MNILRNLIFPLLLGLIGGVVGVLLGLQFFGNKIITSNIQIPVLNQDLDNVNLNSSTAIQGLIRLYRPGEAKFVDYSKSIGVGLALTADGLMASPLPVKTTTGLVGSSFDRVPYNVTFARGVDGKVFFDNTTGLTFFELKNSSGEAAKLSPVSLVKFEDVKIGEAVFSFGNDGDILVHRVVGLGNNDTVQSSDNVLYFIRLDNDLGNGVPVFAQDGRLVGLSRPGGLVLPAEVVENLLNQYLKNKTYSPTKFGITFTDLSQAVVFDATLPKTGLLLKSAPKDSGLKAGDILLSFDGRRFDGTTPFPILLQRYRSGVEVEVVFLRLGVESKIKVVLN